MQSNQIFSFWQNLLEKLTVHTSLCGLMVWALLFLCCSWLDPHWLKKKVWHFGNCSCLFLPAKHPMRRMTPVSYLSVRLQRVNFTWCHTEAGNMEKQLAGGFCYLSTEPGWLFLPVFHSLHYTEKQNVVGPTYTKWIQLLTHKLIKLVQIKINKLQNNSF